MVPLKQRHQPSLHFTSGSGSSSQKIEAIAKKLLRSISPYRSRAHKALVRSQSSALSRAGTLPVQANAALAQSASVKTGRGCHQQARIILRSQTRVSCTAFTLPCLGSGCRLHSRLDFLGGILPWCSLRLLCRFVRFVCWT